MKKILVALLALAVLGGAFAQTFTVGASGGITLIDQDGKASFNRDGSGSDLLTFKGADKDKKWAYSATINNFDSATFFPAVSAVPYTGSALLRNWEASYTGAYTKVILGKVRNGDFRQTLASGWLGNYGGATDRTLNSAYGVIIETTTLGALTAGVGLPISETATDAVNGTFKKTILGAKYAGEGFKVIGLVEPDLNSGGTNIINVGGAYTGVAGLEVDALVKASLASSTTVAFGLGAYYTLDKLSAGVEVDGKSATTLNWEVVVNADYKVMDPLTANVRVTYDDSGAYLARAKATYDYGNNLTSSVEAGYSKALNLFYNVGLGYSVSF